MSINILICGLGGQGLMYMTRLLGNIALRNNYSVSGIETHGMSQRGGSVVAHLKIDSNNTGLIQAGYADCLIALSPVEALRNLHYLNKPGIALINGTALPKHTYPNNAHCYDLIKICNENQLKNKMNVVMTGLFLATQPFNYQKSHIWQILNESSDKHNNTKALQLGLKLGKNYAPNQ